MIGINSDLSCCGIHEIEDIYQYKNKPEIIIEQVCTDIFENYNEYAFLMFSDIKKKIAGKNLTNYIKKHKLGSVTKSASRINPNSKNSLTIWIWALSQKNLKKYYQNHY